MACHRDGPIACHRDGPTLVSRGRRRGALIPETVALSQDEFPVRPRNLHNQRSRPGPHNQRSLELRLASRLREPTN